MVWPITSADLRKALGYDPTQGDENDLTLFATVACERIDLETGRNVDPTRHQNADGSLPATFTLAARETAKLWWQQSKNGPKGTPSDPNMQSGPPMGADLPRKVESWLAGYPPPPGFGQPVEDGDGE